MLDDWYLVLADHVEPIWSRPSTWYIIVIGVVALVIAVSGEVRKRRHRKRETDDGDDSQP